MFNLNIPAASLLSIDSGGICTTPKTPEIVNTLIAMTTNPLDNYSFTTALSTNESNGTTTTSTAATTATTTTGINQQHQQQQQQQVINNNSNNHQLISQDSSHSSCSGSPLDSPAGTNSTLSVQQTCSQFIKAGLKITIQNKRKMSSGDSSSGTEQSSSKCPRKSFTTTTTGETSDDEIEYHKSSKSGGVGLTPEDEDRRRRRRERNKIAATKCRMKKRERTQNLISESEQLETQNIDLKSQVRNLEIERRKLFDMLQSHSSTCLRPGGYQPSPSLCQSPAYKYLNELGFCDSQQQQTHQDIQQQDQQPQSSTSRSQRTAIPSMNTIKFSRNNGLRRQQQQQHSPVGITDLLPSGYCKASPTAQEMGYINSPNQDLTTCLTTPSPPQHLHQNGGNGVGGGGLHSTVTATSILKSDYIPNCENSNGATNPCSIGIDTNTTDFILKHELVDAQSPYTTAQSAERFLFETNCESFDIKHTANSLNCNSNNNNNNSHNNNNTIVDFHTQLIAAPTSCQSSYDSLLIKNDFLTSETELLAQLTDGTDTEFTDLDSGVTAYSHLTNGGCLA